MKLTDEQLQIVAVCAACQARLDVDGVRREAEGGRSTPAQWFCPRCRAESAHQKEAIFELGVQTAVAKIEQRFTEAGLSEHFNRVAQELNMRRRHEQN